MSAFRQSASYHQCPGWGRKAAVIRVGELEFPNDYSAHHFHVGCAISENPQNFGISRFTRQEYDGHLMAALGPMADRLL